MVVLPRRDRELTLDAFGRRADDVIAGDVERDELIARLRVRLERRPLPRAGLVEDPVTGALTRDALAAQLRLELERVSRGGRPGTLAYLALDELPGLAARFGSRARDQLLAQVVSLIKDDGRQLDYIGVSRGLLALLLPDTPYGAPACSSARACAASCSPRTSTRRSASCRTAARSSQTRA